MSDPVLAEVREVLGRTPRVLRGMLDRLPAGLAERPYGDKTWTAKEVVAHLIHAERADWIPRARHIFEHGDARPFEPFDRNGGAPLVATHSLSELLDLFERDRAVCLRELDELNLTRADLERRGMHPALGPVTLGNLLHTWAVHDLNHIAQIAKAVAFQYKDRVGAWEQYLSVLAPPSPR